MTRRLLFLAFALVLVGVCIVLLEITPLKVVSSAVFATALFGVFYWYTRGKPIKFEKSSHSKPTSKRLLEDLYWLSFAAVLAVITVLYPEVFYTLNAAVWPFLGIALFMLALSLYALVRRD